MVHNTEEGGMSLAEDKNPCTDAGHQRTPLSKASTHNDAEPFFRTDRTTTTSFLKHSFGRRTERCDTLECLEHKSVVLINICTYLMHVIVLGR